MFNSLDDQTWINLVTRLKELNFHLTKIETLSYSANSVVQDTRRAGLKTDFILTFRKDPGKKIRDVELISTKDFIICAGIPAVMLVLGKFVLRDSAFMEKAGTLVMGLAVIWLVAALVWILRFGKTYGIGRHEKAFTPGRWSAIEQEVVLNSPGKLNGTVRLWIDGELRVEETNIAMRANENSNISGVISDVGYRRGSKTASAIRLSPFKMSWR